MSTDLTNLKKDELVELAKANDVTIDEAATKAVIAGALSAAGVAAPDSDQGADDARVTDVAAPAKKGDVADDRIYVNDPRLGVRLAAAKGRRMPAWAQGLERVDPSTDPLRQNMAEDSPRGQR